MSRITSTQRSLLIGAGLVALTLLSFAGVFRAGFVDYDDPRYVSDNQRLGQGLSMESIAWALTAREASNWHPLTWLSYMLDAQVFGVRPGPFHAINLALHVVNVIVLFSVLTMMTNSPWRCALVAALFAIHPLHVESVAWISERKDVLSTMFGLLAIAAYVRAVRRRSIARHVLVWAMFALSLMSKPMLVTLPCAMLLLDIWPLRRWRVLGIGSRSALEMNDQSGTVQIASTRSVLVEKLPLFALSLTSSIITVKVQESAVADAETLPLAARMINAAVAYGTYLFQTVWPMDLCAMYPHPGSWPAWRVIASIAAIALITVAAVMMRRTTPTALIGWLWFLGTLVPVIGLVQVGSQAYADRYTYVPLIGVFVMIAWSVPSPRSLTAQQTWATISVVLIAALTWQTILQVGTWRDSLRLFGHALEARPGNFLAHNNLAYTLANRGEFAEAERHFAEALRLNPEYAARNDFVGRALVANARFDLALPHFQRIVPFVPRSAIHHNNVGLALLRLNRAEEALLPLQSAVEIDPQLVEARINLGLALSLTNRLEDAERELRQALRLDANSADAHVQLGLLHARRGALDDAISEFNEALRLRPDDAQARTFLETAVRERGRMP